MNRVHLNVAKMANKEDKTKIKNALEKLDGVTQTAVDMARGTVEIGYNEPASDQSIKDCIENTGYVIL